MSCKECGEDFCKRLSSANNSEEFCSRYCETAFYSLTDKQIVEIITEKEGE